MQIRGVALSRSCWLIKDHKVWMWIGSLRSSKGSLRNASTERMIRGRISNGDEIVPTNERKPRRTNCLRNQEEKIFQGERHQQ